MPYPTRQLGTDGPMVTAMGIGLMGLSRFYGFVGTDEERYAFLDHVYASGNRFWDTADMYGDSEDLLGRWFAMHPGRRETIFLATKFGNTLPGGVSGVPEGGVRSDPAYVHEACARSLGRLGVDAIDLYYVHRIDTVTPIEDTMAALAALKDAGKIRHIGLSEVSAATLRRAHAVHPVAALQCEYSAFTRDIETPQLDLLRTCKELGVAVVAYSPLGRGVLTGQYRSAAGFSEGDFRSFSPRFVEANLAADLKLVDGLAAIAARKGITPGQLVLAWLLRQWPMVIPIPGTKRAKYYDENMAALDVALSDDDEAALRAVMDSHQVLGERYPAAHLHTTYRDSPLPKGK